MRFVDTNVLLYAVSVAPAEQDRAEQVRALLESPDLGLSVQVLGEFYVQATRASRPDPLTHDQASRLIEAFTRFPVQPETAAIVRSALSLRQRHGFSYWDAMIIESARALGCSEVLTGDMQHGQDLGGVRIVNPFLE